MGLTDQQQAILMFISGTFYSVSIITVPQGAPWYVTLTLAMCGAFAGAIKEFLGTATPNG